MKNIPWLLACFLLSTLLTACATSSTNTSLLSNLQNGGYVIFFRHAATNHSAMDVDKKNLQHCDKQRNLDQKGRQQSKQIGDGFKALNLPVGDVVTSYYCRCIDTANIAFQKASATMDITSIQDVTPQVRAQRIANLKAMLNMPPQAGTNTILVAHKWMFKEASGHLLEEGEAAIFRPQAHGNAQFIKRIKPSEWMALGDS